VIGVLHDRYRRIILPSEVIYIYTGYRISFFHSARNCIPSFNFFIFIDILMNYRRTDKLRITYRKICITSDMLLRMEDLRRISDISNAWNRIIRKPSGISRRQNLIGRTWWNDKFRKLTEASARRLVSRYETTGRRIERRIRRRALIIILQ